VGWIGCGWVWRAPLHQHLYTFLSHSTFNYQNNPYSQTPTRPTLTLKPTSQPTTTNHNQPQPTPTNPPKPKKVLDDKIEEEEDRQAILGKDIVNPTTGLTLVDYLEGREALHNEELFKRYGLEEDEDTYIDTEVRGWG